MPGTKLAQSKFVNARPSFTAAEVVRTSDATMSAVTERDADGNPVTHFEMFDPIRLVVQILPWAALLAANPF